MLSLNDIFKESMRKVQKSLGQVGIIVRCEILPQVRGNKEDISQLFEELIRMIVKNPVAGAKLYLYVACSESMDVSNEDEGFKTYTIKFRTNISPNENWESSNIQALDKCRNILSLHHAAFLVNSNNSSGCLFSFSLPGKF